MKGQTSVQCEDFYDEEMRPVDIPISPILSPNQNAAKYYKDYARMKNAEKELTRQLELGRLELDYLKSVLEELNRAGTEGELEEIRRELQEGGYLRPDTDRKRMKQAKLPPMRFESTDGYPIYVGRNNRQNDELTFRLARKDDIWCHASKVHGSHDFRHPRFCRVSAVALCRPCLRGAAGFPGQDRGELPCAGAGGEKPHLRRRNGSRCPRCFRGRVGTVFVTDRNSPIGGYR